MNDYMSRADLYRWSMSQAVAPTQEVVSSASYHILAQDPEHWDETLQNQVCDNWCVALRSALNTAWEEYQVAGHGLANPNASKDYIAECFGRRYVATWVILRLIQAMFRDDAPQEERLV